MGSRSAVATSASRPAGTVTEKQQLILDAVVTVIGQMGVAGISMRAVSREAGVALGLMNYYYDDKTSLIAAALGHIGSQDLEIVRPVDGLDPAGQLRHALAVIATDEYLRPEYLAQRLQLWSLASVSDIFAEINHEAQTAYRDGLARLIAAVRPELTAADVAVRAADILVIQNGIWLTSILLTDTDAVHRGIAKCEAIAFA